MLLYNLHIVKSPLQLINVVEAIDTFHLSNNILVIIDTQKSANNAQMQDVLHAIELHWHKVYHIQKSSGSTLFSYVKLIKELKHFSYDHIFFGGVNSTVNVMFANLTYKNIFLVDDGTATLKRYDILLHDKPRKFSDELRMLRYRFFGLKVYKPYRTNYFTFFNITSQRGEKIVKNEFIHLKKRFNLAFSQHEKVYILGQPIYNTEISEENFLSYLQKIFEYYSGKEIVYQLHRSEVLTPKIEEFLHTRASIQKNRYPVELDFLIKKEYPKHITGFFSTALYTLDMMFPQTEVNAFYISKETFLDKERADIVQNYYDFFINNGIKVIQ